MSGLEVSDAAKATTAGVRSIAFDESIGRYMNEAISFLQSTGKWHGAARVHHGGNNKKP